MVTTLVLENTSGRTANAHNDTTTFIAFVQILIFPNFEYFEDIFFRKSILKMAKYILARSVPLKLKIYK